MTDFGITSAGFVLKAVQDVLTDLNTDMLAEISQGLDVSPLGPDGQRNAIYARQEGALWEIFQVIYDALDPDRAEDGLLISLCKLTGTVPQGATSTLVACDCTLVAGTVLASDGTVAASVAGKPDVLFFPLANADGTNFTAPSTGTFSVLFSAETPGPVPVNATTLTVISTPVTGWSAVNNPLDGRIGQPVDTNETLRLRRAAELAAAGSSTVPGIQADLLQLVDSNGNALITTATVNENETDAVDANGLPPHSVECIIVAPISTTANQIAQGIFNAKGGGPASFGTTSGTATDAQGKTYTVKYSVPQNLLVYLIFDLDTDASYAGDPAFAAAVALAMSAQVAPGENVLAWACEKAAAQPGVTNLHSVKLGFAPSPTGTADLTVTTRQWAIFDSTRISVV
jgi:hypothetical protein